MLIMINIPSSRGSEESCFRGGVLYTGQDGGTAARVKIVYKQSSLWLL